MKALVRILITEILVAGCFAGTVAAQTVVVGTSDPDIDIAAVQAAVDRGGVVVLRGHFSFDHPSASRGVLPDLIAMVVVSKEVTVSGTWDEHGEMTTIAGGEIPFAVEAPGADVTIKRLRFVRPKRSAIFADAVGGLAIESCAIENVEALPPLWNPAGISLGIGIHVSSLLGLPTPERPGKPENVHGKVSIVDNEVSIGEGADHGVGIMVVSVGDSEQPVEVDISGNTVRNANQEGINLKYIGGRVRVERNVVNSNTVYAGPARGPIVGIHCLGSGSYLIVRNRVDIADPNGAGIRVRGFASIGLVIEHTISDNDVTMSTPEGAVLGPGSAGIDVRGFARDNIVNGNRIRGHGRVAVSLAREGMEIPAGYKIDQNDIEDFISSPVDGGKK